MHAFRSTVLLGIAAAVTKVSAHGFVQGIDVDGTYYTGYIITKFPYQSTPPAVIGWTQTATDLGFVAPDAYASGDIICHRGGANAMLTATVKAGGTVRMDWNGWPESHHGPVIDYLAPCSNGDCTTVDKTSLKFFKIAEAGLISDTTAPGSWASDQLIANNNSWSITIPANIAPGPYVLRHEMIALHSANNANGAQNYPQCINLRVTGSGTETPAGTLGEALYTETDPGILANIYHIGLTYTIPGPTLYESGATATKPEPVTTSASVDITPTTFATSVKLATTTSVAPVVTGVPDDECEA